MDSKPGHRAVAAVDPDGVPLGDPALAGEFSSWIEQGNSVRDFKPSSPSAWRKHRSARKTLFDAYLVWVMTKWPRLSLTVPQTTLISNFFFGYTGQDSDLVISTVPLTRNDFSGDRPGFWEQPTALQEATHAMLDNVYLRDTFAHAESKLVASLPSKFMAAHEKHAQRAEKRNKFKGDFDFTVYIAFGEVGMLSGRPAIPQLEAFVGMVEIILREVEAECRNLNIIRGG
jgi:hypothetical protein